MKLCNRTSLSAPLLIVVLATLVSGQYVGLVSKNCDNFWSDECTKSLVDRNGNWVSLGLDRSIVLDDFSRDVGLITFHYRNDPKHLKGLITPNGIVIAAPKYESIEQFNEGLAFVKISDRKSGFVNKNGKLVISSNFFEDSEAAERPLGTNFFSEGLALVAVQVDYSMKGYPIIRYGFIDTMGKLVVGKTNTPLIDLRGFYKRPRFETAKNFSGGLAPVEIKGKWGFVDKSDKTVIPLQFEWANNFSEALASVKQAGKYGFIDKAGSFRIAPRFDDADEFSEGLAAVMVGGLWGYIDQNGSTVIKPQFEHRPEKFSEGLAGFFIGGGVGFGYIDKQGHVAIQPKFGGMTSFSDGFAWIMTTGGAGYIRKDGTFLWNPQQL